MPWSEHVRARVRDRGLFRYFQRRNHRTCLCGHAVHDAQEACLESSAQPDYWLRMDRAVSMLCVSTFVVPAAAQELGVLAALTSEACRLFGMLPWSRCHSRSLDLEPSSPRNTGVVWYSERTWKTFAHEVGHNFGGRPPGSSCCISLIAAAFMMKQVTIPLRKARERQEASWTTATAH